MLMLSALHTVSVSITLVHCVKIAKRNINFYSPITQVFSSNNVAKFW